MNAPLLACWTAILLAVAAPCHFSQAQSPATEASLLQTLESNASLAEKDAACARLRQVGTEKSVPVLGKLLTHPELSHSARFALTGMPYPSAGAELLKAAQSANGTTKAGLIISLGERQETNAVDSLAKWMSDPNGSVAAAAARALGQIGSQTALKALTGFLDNAGGSLKLAIVDSLLAAAERLVKQGRPEDAMETYKQLTATSFTDETRMAAYRGLMAAQPSKAPPVMVEALASGTEPALSAALSLIPDLKSDGLVPALCAALPKLQPTVQASVVQSLASRRDKAAAGTILSLTASSEANVRLQALSALAVLGEASAIPVLVAAAAGGNPADSAAARASLTQLNAEGVDRALLLELEKGQGARKAEAARALAERGERSALPALMRLASASDGASQVAAEALASLARPQNLPELVNLVSGAKDFQKASELSSVLQQAIIRWQAAHEAVDGRPLAEGIQRAEPVAKRALLQAAGSLPDPQVRSELRSGLKDADPEIRQSAIRGLCETTNPELLPELLSVATGNEKEGLRVQATRAITRLVTEDAKPETGSETRLEPLEKLLAHQGLGPAQIRIVLGALGNIPSARSLKLAEKFVKESGVANEAAQTIIRLASSVPETSIAVDALKLVQASAASPEVKAASAPVLKEILARTAFLQQWEVAGPFRQEGKTHADLFSIVFPPELPNGATPWKRATGGGQQGGAYVVDLLKEWPGEQCAGYARTTLQCPRAQKATFEIGSDDGIKIWLNGALVHANNVARAVQPGSDKATVQLAQGNNTVLVKLTQNNAGWGFCIRVLGEDGGPVEGLQQP